MSDFTDANHSESGGPRGGSSSSRPSSVSTPSPSSTPKRSPSPRTPSSPVPNFTPSPAAYRGSGGVGGLSRSLSTNNLSMGPSGSLAPSNPRAPKGLMQKFIASRGKMTGSAFASPPPTYAHTTKGVPTRPMRVEPKVQCFTQLFLLSLSLYARLSDTLITFFSLKSFISVL